MLDRGLCKFWAGVVSLKQRDIQTEPVIYSNLWGTKHVTECNSKYISISGFDLAIKIKDEEKTGRIGSDTQQDTKRPKFFRYWKIKIFTKNEIITGYSQYEVPFNPRNGDYLTVYQNASGIDSITIPLNQVNSIKSYAVTE
ncbi:hypothetical protein [Xenorhabdus stockiae]|uniref:hypothetical protein n=1 Tax=Xenorhabdus stockiae TaxID=351614 RepID=UPI000C051231|nr:hypothetical protein [Xenorhabdus stockiae]